MANVQIPVSIALSGTIQNTLTTGVSTGTLTDLMEIDTHPDLFIMVENLAGADAVVTILSQGAQDSAPIEDIPITVPDGQVLMIQRLPRQFVNANRVFLSCDVAGVVFSAPILALAF